MTDKQIIIDGVDVSGCAGYYFSPTKFHSCQDIQQVNNLGYEQDTLCEQNHNCYYKQLKRKEQECEELKAKCKKYGEINEQETKDYAELKAENDLFRTCHDNEQAKRRKYEQAIEDIKEIAEICCKTTDCKKCKFFEICENNCVDVILQKISECEGNNG